MEKQKDPIGQLLRKARKDRQVSVPELAELLGIPKDRIYKWEKGVTPKYEDRQVVEKWMSNENWKKVPNSNSSNIEANLAAIANSLARLENGQHYIRAEIRGYGQYQIQQEVGWDQEKFLQAMAKVGMIVGANLKAGDLGGSNAAGGS